MKYSWNVTLKEQVHRIGMSDPAMKYVLARLGLTRRTNCSNGLNECDGVIRTRTAA